MAADFLTAAEGAAGGIAASTVVVLPVLRWVWRRLVRSVAEDVAELLRETRRISEQVIPNGGQGDALATRVARIEALLRETPPTGPRRRRPQSSM